MPPQSSAHLLPQSALAQGLVAPQTMLPPSSLPKTTDGFYTVGQPLPPPSSFGGFGGSLLEAPGPDGGETLWHVPKPTYGIKESKAVLGAPRTLQYKNIAR